LPLPPRPRVVFTGRLHPQKNLDVLIRAWPAVAGATGATLVLVGQGPERDRLEAEARALGVGDRVRFTGPVDDPADLLRAADVFVLPSVAEGMSNSLLEAMATALPCVASDIGGNHDLLAPEGAGVLVADGSPEGWAEALIGLLNDPARRQRLGAAARRRVDQEYDLGRVVARYVALYRRLLDDTGPA
jgi:glycosyltransferase involved in cell wall biosynthesis